MAIPLAKLTLNRHQSASIELRMVGSSLEGLERRPLCLATGIESAVLRRRLRGVHLPLVLFRIFSFRGSIASRSRLRLSPSISQSLSSVVSPSCLRRVSAPFCHFHTYKYVTKHHILSREG